jgi:hypothetical protein
VVTLCSTRHASAKCHYRACAAACARIATDSRRRERAAQAPDALDQRRRRVSRIPRALTILCAALLPGSGHLLRGAPRRASTFLLLALTVVIATRPGVIAGRSFLPASAAGSSVPVALAVYFLLAVVSVIGALRLPEPREDEEPVEAAARGGKV